MATPQVTRFHDGGSDQDGPVSGALQIIVLNFESAVATNTTVFQQVHLPAGMRFKVTDVEVFCGTVTSDPSLTIGTTAAGTQVVAAANLATGANVATVKAAGAHVAAGGLLDIRITADAGDAIALPLSVNIVGHVSAPPTSVM